MANDPLFLHVVLMTSKLDMTFLVECTCGWSAIANTVPQVDILVGSHDRFVLSREEERTSEAE